MAGEIKVDIQNAQTQLQKLASQLEKIKKLQSDIASQSGSGIGGNISGMFQMRNVDGQLRAIETQMKRLQVQHGMNKNLPEFKQLADVKNTQGTLRSVMQGGGSNNELMALAKRFLPELSAVALVGWGINKTKQGFNNYRQDSQQLSDLGRNVKSTTSTFQQFRKEVLAAGDAIGYSNQQMTQLAQSYTSLVGKVGSRNLGGTLGTIAGFSKSFGMDPTQAGSLFGAAGSMGVTAGVGASMTPQGFAALLANSIVQGNMQGRQNELIQSLNSLVQQIQSNNVYAPNPTLLAGMLTTMNQTGVMGLMGRNGAQLLSGMNNAIMNPGGGIAGQYLNYSWLNPTGQLSPFQVQYLQNQGLTGVNPYTGQSNFQSEIQGALTRFHLGGGLGYQTVNGHKILNSSSAQAVSQLGGMWNMSPQQAEALLNTFTKNGKVNIASVGGFGSWLNNMVGSSSASQLMSSGNVQTLASIYGAKNSGDLVSAGSAFTQMGGKLPSNWKQYLGSHSVSQGQSFLLQQMQGSSGLTGTDQLTKSYNNVEKAAENTASSFAGAAKALNDFKAALLGNPSNKGGPSLATGVDVGIAGAIGTYMIKRNPGALTGLGGRFGGMWSRFAGMFGGGAAAGETAAAGGGAVVGDGALAALGPLGLMAGTGALAAWLNHSYAAPTHVAAGDHQVMTGRGPMWVNSKGKASVKPFWTWFGHHNTTAAQTPSGSSPTAAAAMAQAKSSSTMDSLQINNLTIGNLYRTGATAGNSSSQGGNSIFNPKLSNLVYFPSQGGTGGLQNMSLTTPVPFSGSGSGISQWGSLITSAASKYGINPLLIAAVMQHESGGSSGAMHKNGNGTIDAGLMQVNSSNWRAYGITGNPYDPKSNVNAGAAILAQDVKKYGLIGGLSAYNSGSPNSSAGLNYAAIVEGIMKAFQAHNPITVHVTNPQPTTPLGSGLQVHSL